jgi:transposase-like protein
MGRKSKFSPEVRERAVRLVLDGEGQHAERDAGRRPGPTTSERERVKELEREVRELKRRNEILRKASAFFAQAELDRRPK